MEQEIDNEKFLLRIKAINLAEHLFEKYIEAVCKQIGFDAAEIDICMGLRFDKGSNWHEAENLKIEVSAEICEAFRKAYINIGVLKPVE